MNRSQSFYHQHIRHYFTLTICLGGCLSLLSRPATAELFAVADQNLYRLSTSDATSTQVGALSLSSFSGIAYRQADDRLYGFGGFNPGFLASIDPATAAVTVIGNLPFQVAEGGVTFAPDGRLIGVGRSIGQPFRPALFSVDLDTSVVTNLGVVSGGDRDINGIAWRDDGKLVGLDRISNSLLEIDPVTGQSFTISFLSPTLGATGGITREGNDYYFATAGPSSFIPGSNQLFRFDPYTGASNLVGSLGFAAGVSGLAGSFVIPEPASLTLAFLLAAVSLIAARPNSRHLTLANPATSIMTTPGPGHLQNGAVVEMPLASFAGSLDISWHAQANAKAIARV